MKRTKILITILVVLLALSACGKNTDQPTENGGTTEMSNSLTLEYVLANTDMTEADFADIDFQAFVDYYGLTEESLQTYHLPDLVQMYREKQQDQTQTYTHIFQAAEGSLAAEDLDDIQVLLWERHEGSDNYYMVIDYRSAKVYSSRMDIFKACRESDLVAQLNQEDVQFVNTCLEESNIVQWENTYIGTNEGTTESASWAFAFLLADGRCVSYRSTGIINAAAPAEAYVLMDALATRFGG